MVGALLAAALLAIGLNPGGFDSEPAPRETAAPAPYPITGYFVSSTSDDSRNFQKLSDIKAVGGDTVITFGNSLLPVEVELLPPDCSIDGEKCAKVVAGKSKVNRYFTYSDGGRWGHEAEKCPLDRTVESNNKVFTLLLFPVDSEGCTSPTDTYDMVVTGGSRSSATDPSVSLARAAAQLDMKFYVGMPAPAKRTDVEYLPDLTYEHTLELFTERFLEHQAAVNDVPGLAGFYHHLEMPVSDNPFFEPILSVYSMQNEAVHRILPTRSAIVSPYIEARRDAASITLQNARDGIKKIAQTASGLQLNIAIQDGMGTGKGAAFTKSEANMPVDEYAASIVGKGTWDQRYVASNKDYFDAAASGITGTGAQLWANLEGMAPATKANPCDNSLRGQTTLERINNQLQQTGKAQKIISYMWDPYYTCQGRTESLKSQLDAGFTAPIVTDTSFDAEQGQVHVTGYNVAGKSLIVEWTTKDGKQLQREVEAPGVASARRDETPINDRLETAVVEIGSTSLRTANSYTVRIQHTPSTSSAAAR